MISGRTLAVLLCSAVLAGCATQTNQGSNGDIEGVWLLESYTNGGDTVDVEVGVNAASQPYVVFRDEMSGDGGCNGFGGDFEYSDGVLRPGEVFSETGACLPDALMDAELVVLEVLGRGSVDVRFDRDRMIWHNGGRALGFVAAEVVPPEPTIPPQTSVGPLDCGDREVVREKVPANGSDFETFRMAGETLTRGLDGVDTLEQEDPTSLRWYGYDEAGEAIVVVSFEDVSPEMFSIFTCP